MNKNYYKENKNYGDQLNKDYKISARERNTVSRIMLLKKANIISPAMLLEVGCHEGLFLQQAKNEGFDVLGIEPNIYAANYARERGLPVINGLFEDIFNEVENKKFDVVVLFHAIEHMTDYLENLKKIRTIIKPGGYLVIEVPNSESYRSKKYGINWVYVYEEHLHHFSPGRLGSSLTRLGFSVKKKYYRDFDDMRGSIKWSLDRLLPIKFKNTNVRNNFEEKISLNKSATIIHSKNILRPFLSPLKFFLTCLVKVFGRGDFIMVVAKLDS